MTPPDDPRIPPIHRVMDAIEKRLDEARERDTYEDKRVDLLAVIQYIQRNLAMIDSQFPPDSREG